MIVIGLVSCLCCGLPWAWFSGSLSKYPVGANIKTLGLTPGNTRYYIWSSGSREPIAQFAKRRQVQLAHFTGSIELSRINDPMDRVQFQFMDGKLAVKPQLYHDLALLEDQRVLKTGRLSDMLAKTTNDWRILNHNNHFIDPEGPFTGEITINLREGYPYTSAAILNVKNDVIIRSRRSLLLTID